MPRKHCFGVRESWECTEPIMQILVLFELFHKKALNSKDFSLESFLKHMQCEIWEKLLYSAQFWIVLIVPIA